MRERSIEEQRYEEARALKRHLDAQGMPRPEPVEEPTWVTAALGPLEQAVLSTSGRWYGYDEAYGRDDWRAYRLLTPPEVSR